MDQNSYDINEILTTLKQLSVKYKDKKFDAALESLTKLQIQQSQNKTSLSAASSEFQLMMKNNLFPVVFMTGERIVKDANQKFTELTGFSNDELVGQSIQIVHIDEDHFKKFGELYTSELPLYQQVHEYPFKHKNGEILWGKLFGTVVEKDGVFEGYLWTIEDITEKKNAHEKIKESEKRYRNLVDDAPVPIIVHSAGIFKYLNKRAVETFQGTSKEEFIGKNILDFVHPDDMEIAMERAQAIYDVATDSLPPKFEKLLTLKGEVVYAEVSGIKIEYDGATAAQLTLRVITEQVLAQTALKETEFNLQNAQKLALMGTWLYYEKENKFKWTKELLELLGQDDDEVKNLSDEFILNHVHPEDKSSVERILMEARIKTQQFSVEFRYTRSKVDTERWGHIFIDPFTNENGDGIGYKGSMQDISERKSIELELREKNIFIQKILDLNPNHLYIYDTHSRDNVYLNARLVDYLGYSEEEILSMGSELYSTLIHPDDMAITQKHQKKIEKAGDNDIISLSYRMLDNRGDYHWFLSREAVFHRDINGNVAQVIGATMDITSQKSTEQQLKDNVERLRITTNAAKLALWDLDLISDDLTISEQYAAMLGFKSGEMNLLKGNWKDYIFPEDLSRFLSELEDYIEGRSKSFQIEYRMKPKYSGYVWVLSSGEIVEKTTSGKPLRMVGIHANITNLRNVKEELLIKNKEIELQNKALLDAKEKAEESDRLKTAFLQNMSHEIRTPMNGIIGFAEFLKEEELTEEERQEYIDIINSSSHQLLNIVNDILDISKIETGQMKCNYTFFNINDMLVSLFQFFKPQADKKKLELMLEHPEDNLMVFSDVKKLKQIFTNLLSNALKYTNSGSIKFGYSVHNENIISYVEDTGVGINPEKQKVIFERFRQLNQETTRSDSGTGLGLAISKGLIELLKGEINIDENYDSGARFVFSIPYKSYQQGMSEPQNKIEKISSITDAEKYTILVAEDEPANYKYLEDLLKRHSFNIVRASNGQEAIDIIAAGEPNIHLVLMDIKMPGINGYEATGRILKIKPDIKIIAVTAYAMEQDVERSLAAGCHEHISKPYTNKQLIAAIKNHLPI